MHPIADPFVYHILHERPTTLSQSDKVDPGAAGASPLSPSPALLERLAPEQRQSFSRVWDKLPCHLRDTSFNLYGPGLTPDIITELGNVLCEYHGVFSSSPTDFPTDVGSCSLFPFKLGVPPSSAPFTSRPTALTHRWQNDLTRNLFNTMVSGGYISDFAPLESLGYHTREIWWCSHHYQLSHALTSSLCALSQLSIPRVDDTLDKLF